MLKLLCHNLFNITFNDINNGNIRNRFYIYVFVKSFHNENCETKIIN